MTDFIKYLLTITLLIQFNGQSQEYFEGKIHYKIEYETINKNIPDRLLEIQMGDSFDAYVKEDKYVMIYNGKGELGKMKSIIRLDEGFSYLLYENSDTIYKSSLEIINDKLLNLKIVTNDKKEVFGEMCDYVILDYETGDPNAFFKVVRGKHYFNPKYRLNSKMYKDYKSGFWNQYVNEANAISIRNEHEYEGLFKSVSYATDIIEQEISDEIFVIDSDKFIKVVD